jgi:hypothetical protein
MLQYCTFKLYDKKVKVKLSLCFNWASCHEGVLGEWMYSSTHSLTSALNGGEWSASRPSCFTPRERAPGTHWIGGWVGTRTVLDVVVKRKIPSPHRESNPRTPIIQPIAQRYTDSAITALQIVWYRGILGSTVWENKCLQFIQIARQGEKHDALGSRRWKGASQIRGLISQWTLWAWLEAVW